MLVLYRLRGRRRAEIRSDSSEFLVGTLCRRRESKFVVALFAASCSHTSSVCLTYLFKSKNWRRVAACRKQQAERRGRLYPRGPRSAFGSGNVFADVGRRATVFSTERQALQLSEANEDD